VVGLLVGSDQRESNSPSNRTCPQINMDTPHFDGSLYIAFNDLGDLLYPRPEANLSLKTSHSRAVMSCFL
jgi:hypothetical protein